MILVIGFLLILFINKVLFLELKMLKKHKMVIYVIICSTKINFLHLKLNLIIY